MWKFFPPTGFQHLSLVHSWLTPDKARGLQDSLYKLSRIKILVDLTKTSVARQVKGRLLFPALNCGHVRQQSFNSLSAFSSNHNVGRRCASRSPSEGSRWERVWTYDKDTTILILTDFIPVAVEVVGDRRKKKLKMCVKLLSGRQTKNLAVLLQEARAKREEKERKKAEVRKRLEEASKAKKGVKKGFLNPERKRKLRVTR